MTQKNLAWLRWASMEPSAGASVVATVQCQGGSGMGVGPESADQRSGSADVVQDELFYTL